MAIPRMLMSLVQVSLLCKGSQGGGYKGGSGRGRWSGGGKYGFNGFSDGQGGYASGPPWQLWWWLWRRW